MSKWSRADDKTLYMLMCYIHLTPTHTLESFVGDDAKDCHFMMYSDADFAGDTQGSKSISGSYIAIVGPN